MNARRLLIPCWLLAGALALCCAAGAASDFTFVHVSDVHFPYAADQSRATLASMSATDPVVLAPYGVTVPAPSFVIVTGDLNEFGGGSGWWEAYLELWRGLGLPVYHQLGNHDNTWDCGRPRLRGLHGSPFYAFEHSGVKFIGWDTATPQDPRPSIATEGLLWLRAELEATPPAQPIVFFCHHPLDGREFSGEYEKARLLELLQTRNVVLLLVGHGHGVRHMDIAGFDAVMGGSTFGKRPGFGIVSVQGDVLRVCHQHVSPEPEMVALLGKPLSTRSPFLQIAPVSGGDGAVFGAHDGLEWAMHVDPADAVREARWTLDGEQTGDLTREKDTWTARIGRDEVEPGAHTVRFEFTGADSRVTSRTVTFWLDGGPFRIQWKQQLSGSCQSTPTVADGRLYVGANDGTLYAFEGATGRLLWRFVTGGEVRSQPAIDNDTGSICFGSADGSVYALDRDGSEKWRFDTGSPIYASPTLVGGRVLCGTNGGDAVALDAKTGGFLWRSDAPEYAIETALCADEGAAYAGAWDRFVYALGLDDGALRWRVPSRGSDREGTVARYYSPADCGPVVCGGNVFVADRAYYLTILDARSGERIAEEEKCVAVSASGDGRFVYVRHTDGRVTKRESDGSVVWTADVPTGSLATPPARAGDDVLVLSTLGTLSVIDDEVGRVVAQYKVFPDIYAFAAPAFDSERIYVADMAGHLLALAPSPPDGP